MIKMRDVIKQLEPYVTEARKQRIEEILAQRIASVHVAIEQPSNIFNALAVIRTAEILGLTTLHIISENQSAEGIRGMTQGAYRWITIHYSNNIESFLPTVNTKLAGASLVGTMSLEEIPLDEPITFLFGNEQKGLSDFAQQSCDYLYKIPMFGMTESYNLSVSAGISLYETLKRKRQQLGKNSDLNEMQYEKLKADYYCHSVDPRLVQQILNDL